MNEVLNVAGVTKRFGGLTAVRSLDLRVAEGELLGLIGPNGAGKTTVFNLVTGVYTPTEGTIAVCGQPIAGKSPDAINALGVARTFQNIRLFDEMTVLENVVTACATGEPYGLLDAVLRTKRFRAQEAEVHEQSMQLLERLGLADDAQERSSSLAYGEQRRLEIARALATRPRLLILDEPAAGMNAAETEELMSMLHGIKADFDLTLLLIEHDMKFIMRMCERIVVLDQGRQIAQGTPKQVKEDPVVIAAYLGDAAVDIELHEEG